MKVCLISHTPDPEKLVATAAKLCYSSVSVEETQKKSNASNTADFIKMLSDMGHESPLEHITFTFGISGVSRTVLAQLTRHRIASYSVQSQRYVKIVNANYIVPPEIEKIPEAKEEFLIAVNHATEHYEKLTSILEKSYAKLSPQNHDTQNISQKKAIEDARYVLPNSTPTNIICTFNARSLLNFFSQRCCNRAQWEIRELAKKMLKLVRCEAPNIFKTAGPSCLKGPCHEGKMSCKQSKTVREEFKNI